MNICLPMKPYSFFILLFSCFTVHAQWQWCNPQPTGYLNHSIVFVDNQHGFIVNFNGDVLRTSDQGATWHIQQNLPDARTIDYKDSTIVISAFGAVYVSKDLGQTWQRRTVPHSYWFDVQVISRDTIFISSLFPDNPTYVFLSVDRGNTWQQINPNLIIKSFWMFNASNGFATSYNGIYKTTDGGRTWNIPDSSAPGGGSCIKFRNTQNGFVYGQNHLWTTVDGGLHWKASVSQVGAEIKSIVFVDANTIIAIGEDGIMLRSTDNGITWSGVSTGGANDAYGLYSGCFVDPSIGFTVGHRGRILKTTNGGLTWVQYATTYVDMDAVDFVDKSIGYAATWNNIYKTTDAGSSWSVLPLTTPGSFDRFRYIHFFSKDSGVALSETPVRVYKTYNAGTSWQEIPFNNLYNSQILGAFFLNQTIFLSTNGPYGYQVLRSQNAGESWSVQNSGTGYSNPFFTDAKTGYGVNGYYVFKTIDSAKTWKQLAMIPVQILQSLWFTNDTTGFVVGNSSYIAKTSDSGHTWTQMYIDPTNGNVPGDLKGIKFFNEKIGFVINGRNLYRTINGGKSWTVHGISPWEVDGIEIVDSVLYLYGIYGSILKRNIRTYEIDSLNFNTVTSCGAKLSASVSALFSSVDSAWFQYGITNYDSTIIASPSVINDTILKVNAVLTGLAPHTNYIVRLKVFYEGNYYYSNSITFITESQQTTPVITQNGGTLFSSSSQGNQWYRDNVLIPGATQSSYTPTQSGSYTVNTTTAGCTSGMSAPFAYIVTGITNPLPQGAVTIFPNPVVNTLNIQNNQLKELQIRIFNVLGVEISMKLTSKKDNPIDMRPLPRGIYLVNVSDVRTSNSLQKLVVKL
jgi:photosystem II stability/assembly factor-like uncharacterized protein